MTQQPAHDPSTGEIRNTGRSLTPVDTFKSQLERAAPEFALALPPHIPVDRFRRVVQTAVLGDPKLLNADRRSLFQAAQKAAQDGLLPDGREGALVVYGNQVAWLPMVAGVLKKARNSGELVSLSPHVVYERDHFEYVLGDDERIVHRPSLEQDRGQPIAAYCIAKMKDGGIYREVMSAAEVEHVRSFSRAKGAGPWVNHWGEMAKKTVIRRLAKRLPMSTDLDDLIRRDDALYDFKSDRGHGERPHRPVVNPLSDAEPPPMITDVHYSDIEHDAGQQENPDASASLPSSEPASGPGAGARTPASDGGTIEFSSGKQSWPTPEQVLAAQEAAENPLAPDADAEKELAETVERVRRHGAESAKRNKARTPPQKLLNGSAYERAAWFDGYDQARAEMEAGEVA